jgi:hypothetical protein
VRTLKSYFEDFSRLTLRYSEHHEGTTALPTWLDAVPEQEAVPWYASYFLSSFASY